MPEEPKTSVVKSKIVLEGVEEYKEKLNEIRVEANRTKAAVDELGASLRQLNELMEESAELRKKLF